jgi:transposase
MEQWVTIRTLKKQNSELGTRQIADLLGVSRNTVKRALRSEGEPKYVRTPVVNPDLHPFEEYIFEQRFVKRLRGSRILNDLRSKGYRGSQSAFYRYLCTLQDPVKRTFKRYETAPGEQAQFDWSEYTVLLAGILTKVYVFIFILGFSRYRKYRGSLSETQGSIFEAMEKSLYAVGGVTERVQTDNAGSFVVKRAGGGYHWNPRYLAFAAHFGFQVSRSEFGHPWSKGKVENPFDYLEDQFIAGNAFASFEDFINKLSAFETAVNNRVHATTREAPALLFEREEKNALKALPAHAYVGLTETVRKVTADSLIAFDGSRYSVPDHFALREVWARVSMGYLLEISSTGGLIIATHHLSPVKGKVIIDERHYTRHKIERGNWNRLSVTFLERFPDHSVFLDRLKAQKRIDPAYHLTRILDLLAFCDRVHLEAAFSACSQYNTYNVNFIKGYLENHATVLGSGEKPGPVAGLPTTPPITRALREYSDIVNQLSLPLTKGGSDELHKR